MFKTKLSESEGFLSGWGLFETMQAYRGKTLALNEHLDRLFKSAKKINLKITQSPKTFKTAIIQAAKTNFKNTYIRLNIWKDGQKSSFNLIVKEYIPPVTQKYQRGFKAMISSFRTNEYSPLSGVKSLNYLLNILARDEAKKKGFDEAIFLNNRGLVAEGSRSNIFIVRNNQLLTPSLDCGILPGITRKIVISLAKKNKIKVKETHLTLGDLKTADEIFLTNSLIQIMPVAKIYGISHAKSLDFEVTKKLIQLYAGNLPH